MNLYSGLKDSLQAIIPHKREHSTNAFLAIVLQWTVLDGVTDSYLYRMSICCVIKPSIRNSGEIDRTDR